MNSSEDGRSQAAWHRITDWYNRQGWTPFPFQTEAWKACVGGWDVLINAPTGHGKTLSAFLGPVIGWLAENSGNGTDSERTQATPQAMQVLWITPLRALANDTAQTLDWASRGLGLSWNVDLRTGDVSSTAKSRQRKTPPTVLVTTPESASVLLSYPTARDQFSELKAVVVDEWHELMGTKRGVMTELVLARLRAFSPGIRTMGLSATLGNMEEALSALCGVVRGDQCRRRLIRAETTKETEILTVIPPHMERFPWVGHLGIRQLDIVVELIAQAKTTLLFTNVRSQAEMWFRGLCDARPDWVDEDQIGLHHGSLDRSHREAMEQRLAAGTIRVVVCTSSLDLGVDFAPVEQVIQVGSPKGVARLLQRAGRSGHQPGMKSRVWCVPTHALELVEYAAARDGAKLGRMESRVPLLRPLDLLVQHLVTAALGGGFRQADILQEIRGTWAYADLRDDEFQWCLDFVRNGGSVLSAYPQYCRASPDESGIWRVSSRAVERSHRLNIGTITSDASVAVRLPGHGTLGTVEESFVARLVPGNRFVFSGRVLEFVRLKDMVAEVRTAKSRQGIVPRWAGSRMPLSSELSEAVRVRLQSARQGDFDGPEMEAVRPILEVQGRWSRIPGSKELLLEVIETQDGHHLFLYPFEGRLVHEGLGALLAHRIAQRVPRTISVMVNDYGLELLSDERIPTSREFWSDLLSPSGLVEDLLDCLNSGELARRHFREIARVAGLLHQGYPGNPKSSRQLQSSSGLLYDVFQRFDPGNLLMDQARREVLDQQLEVVRMKATLTRLVELELVIEHPRALTPLSFPIWSSRVETQISTENWSDRIQRMALVLDEGADGDAAAAQSAAEAAVPSEDWTTASGLDKAAQRRISKRQNQPRFPRRRHR